MRCDLRAERDEITCALGYEVHPALEAAHRARVEVTR
jgi:hypothetical protein